MRALTPEVSCWWMDFERVGGLLDDQQWISYYKIDLQHTPNMSR